MSEGAEIYKQLKNCCFILQVEASKGFLDPNEWETINQTHSFFSNVRSSKREKNPKNQKKITINLSTESFRVFMRRSEKENSHYSNDFSSQYSSSSGSTSSQMTVQSSKPRVPFAKINSNEGRLSSQSLSQSIKAFQDRNKNHQSTLKNSQQNINLQAKSTSNQNSILNNPNLQQHPLKQTLTQPETDVRSSRNKEQCMSQIPNQVSQKLEESIKKAQSYQKQSALYRCLSNGMTTLSCSEENHSELNIFCATCSEILCGECLNLSIQHNSDSVDKQKHEGHCILNVNQFMEHPILAFLQSEKLLSQVVQQNNLILKIKDEASRSKKVLKDYLASIVHWITKQASAICEGFEGALDEKLKNIEKSIASIQSISCLFKNEWDNWVTSNEITSKNSLEELCKSFLNSSDNPISSVKSSYENLNSELQTIPELNIQAFKDLYFRVCDSFRFSTDYLVTSKVPPENNEQSIQQKLEKLQSNFSNKLQIGNIPNVVSSQLTTTSFQCVASFIPLQDDLDKFLTVSSDKRQVNFISKAGNELKILNTLTRNEGEEIENLIPLKDKKTIAISSAKSFELFSLQTGKSFFKEKLSCSSVCELPTQKILVADGDNRNVQIYALEDLKNIKRIGSFNPNMQINHIDFTIIPSNVHFKDIKMNAISDIELIAIASSLSSGSKLAGIEASYKNVIQLWDSRSLTLIKCLVSSELSKGVSQIKFVHTSKQQGSTEKYSLFVLTNDSKLLVWDYLNQSNAPEIVINLSEEKQYESQGQKLLTNPEAFSSNAGGTNCLGNLKLSKQFQLVDEETIMFASGKSVLVVSIPLRKIIGSFVTELNSEEKGVLSEINEYDSINFSMKNSPSNSNIFTSLLIAKKQTFDAIQYIATSKYNTQTNNSEIELYCL